LRALKTFRALLALVSNQPLGAKRPARTLGALPALGTLVALVSWFSADTSLAGEAARMMPRSGLVERKEWVWKNYDNPSARF